MVGFAEHGVVLRHALAHADELRRMCIVNGQPARTAARALGLDPEQARGAVRLLRKLKYEPSKERLALVVMRDWGLDDEDIAEIFSKPKVWAEAVRFNADKIKAKERMAFRRSMCTAPSQRRSGKMRSGDSRLARRRFLSIARWWQSDSTTRQPPHLSLAGQPSPDPSGSSALAEPLVRLRELLTTKAPIQPAVLSGSQLAESLASRLLTAQMQALTTDLSQPLTCSAQPTRKSGRLSRRQLLKPQSR